MKMDNKKKIKKTVSDTVCRVHKFGGYAVLSNCFVRSTNLGCPAIGLLGRVLDLPPEWNFTKAGLIAVCPDDETAVESALADLEEWGYLQKIVQMPNESPTGRIRTVYNFYEYSEKDHSIPRYDYELETYTVDNATLNRVKKVGNYSMISSKLLRNREIKNKLLGFLLKVLSLPNYWNFSMSGLVAICKEGKTAVHNAVVKLIDMGYLVRTKLLPNESIHNCFEYVYSFFDKPVSKEDADEIEAETRRKAITIREGGRAKKAASSTAEKQEAENLYLDSQPSETLPSENQGQYNTRRNTSFMKCISLPSLTTSGQRNPSEEFSQTRNTAAIFYCKNHSATIILKRKKPLTLVIFRNILRKILMNRSLKNRCSLQFKSVCRREKNALLLPNRLPSFIRLRVKFSANAAARITAEKQRRRALCGAVRHTTQGAKNTVRNPSRFPKIR